MAYYDTYDTAYGTVWYGILWFTLIPDEGPLLETSNLFVSLR